MTKSKTKNRKRAAAVAVKSSVGPQATHHTYFEECQLTRTSKNVKDRKIIALEINRLIHGALSQDAKFVDLQWDEKNKWFTVFARRTRQVPNDQAHRSVTGTDVERKGNIEIEEKC